MITKVFEYYYTMDMHPARLKPLTKEELGRGMSAEAVEKYLSLVEQLYHAFFFDVNADFVPIPEEERRQKWITRERIYKGIIQLLFKQDAITDDVFCELNNSLLAEFNLTDHPGNPGKYIGDSLDDFRLAFEYSLVENDPNIDLPGCYLDERYGYSVCVKPNTPSGIVKSSDLYVIRFEGTYPDLHSAEASYWEVRQLLKTIRRDMEKNTDEQKLLDDILCKPKGTHHSYMDSLQKTIYGRPKNAAEWYTMKRAFEREADCLWRVEDEISRIFETMSKPNDGVGFGATLFIYKGNVLCHKHKHPLVPATAMIHDEQDREVELDVEYCPICKRYMLNYTSYEQYRERHGLLIGKLKMISGNGAGGEFDMAAESPLKLCGYNVSQTGGLATGTRQFLLAKIIHDGIMSKLDVIHYLEHFINMNGAKIENVLALEKWSDDLDFVHKYDKNIQPKVYIGKIKRYRDV